jgi:uncharacterized membrane protein YedE/YeeE
MGPPSGKQATVLLPVLVLGAVAFALGWTRGWVEAVLFALGIGLGAVLWQSAFSFAGAWRRAVNQRRTAGVRAQFLLVGLTACLFLPALDAGAVLGQPVRGFIFPVGLALLLGAFLFGIGMQLGGGCGSGTLYAAGGGASRSWLTLIGFITGATLAAWRAELWMAWPTLAPVPIAGWAGPWPTLLGSLLLLSALAGLALWWERTRHPDPTPVFAPAAPRWSLGAGALLLTGLGFATLVIAGRPWAITAAFPLWGSKAIEALGVDDPAFWLFWEDPTRTEALLRPVLSDRITLMDLGVIGGAFLAAALAHAPRDRWRAPFLGPALAAMTGGLLMGIGAVLASGCNISAFLGGVASGSLHGWVWIAAAMPGTALGIWLRRWFRLEG